MRVHLLRTPLGSLNADEAYTGLQAMSILNGELPVLMGGAGYTAIFDSYFFVPFVWIFGAHVVPLKLLSSLWWAGAALLMYWLAKRFVGRSWGLLAGSMVWVAPGALMLLSTRAYEAYGLGLLVSVLTAFATIRIVTDRELPRRWVMLAGAGAGLAFYLHPMFIAVALPIMAVPCWIHRREIRRWWIPAAGSAIFVNMPLLLWNVRNSWPSLAQPAPSTESAPTRLGRFFTGLLPRSFGLKNPGGDWIWGSVSIVLYVVLLGLIVWGAWFGYCTSGNFLLADLVAVQQYGFCDRRPIRDCRISLLDHCLSRRCTFAGAAHEAAAIDWFYRSSHCRSLVGRHLLDPVGQR